MLPASVFEVLAGLGVWIAVAVLPRSRRNSQGYLTEVLGRPASWRDVWRHYRTFLTMHQVRLSVAGGRPHRYHTTSCEDFRALMISPRPALLGTFHVGNSDLLGFFLGEFQRHVHMVRFRLGDPNLLRQVARTCGAWVSFIWVNEQDDLLFALKHAIDSGGTLAMKCDRDGYSARRETFMFLGAPRSFPFTIYYLGILFKRPVTFCIAVPSASNESAIRGFPVFEPSDDSKQSNLLRARAHFQGVLAGIETLLRTNPYLWFNFEDFHAAELRAPTSPTDSVSPAPDAVAANPDAVGIAS